MTDERRRFTWGEQDFENFDPFEVDVNGHFYNSKTGKKLKPLNRNEGSRRWKQQGQGNKLHKVDLNAPRSLGDRIMAPKADDLVVEVPDIEEWDTTFEPPVRLIFSKSGIETVCLFQDLSQSPTWDGKSSPIPIKLGRHPESSLAAVGNVESNWFFLRIPGKFAALVHGPSLAARVFCDMRSTTPRPSGNKHAEKA